MTRVPQSKETCMDITQIKLAQAEAERFLSKVQGLLDASPSSMDMMLGTPETSAVRRASMDLTRQLAKMRK